MLFSNYSFNNQEHDDEVYGDGNSMTAEFWQYDARLGRRWNLDPKSQMSISDYATFANNPIYNIDPNGDEVVDSKKRFRTMKDGTEKELKWYNFRRADRIEITHTVIGAKMIDLTGTVPEYRMNQRAKEIQSEIETYWNTSNKKGADENGYITNSKGQKLKVTTTFQTDIEVVKDIKNIGKNDNVFVVTTEDAVNKIAGQTAMEVDMVTQRNVVFMSPSSIAATESGGHAHEFGHILSLLDVLFSNKESKETRLMYNSGSVIIGPNDMYLSPMPKPSYKEFKRARGKKGRHSTIPSK